MYVVTIGCFSMIMNCSSCSTDFSSETESLAAETKEHLPNGTCDELQN